MDYLKSIYSRRSAVGQILIDKTKLTPANFSYVCCGQCILQLIKYISRWLICGAGATVPLTGLDIIFAKVWKKPFRKKAFWEYSQAV